MKTFRSIVATLILAALEVCARAQGTTGGLLYASDFANWSLPQGNTPMQGTVYYSNPDICKVTSNGYTFLAGKVGRPLTIVDGVNTETFTPTAVVVNNNACMISGIMAHSHSSYSIKSGTAGAQEAVDYQARLPQGANVVLTPAWTAAGGATGIVTSTLTGNTGVTILDQRTAVFVPYTWNGSHFVAQPFSGGTIAPGSSYAIPCYPASTSATVNPCNITADATGNNLTVPGTVAVGGAITATGGVVGNASSATTATTAATSNAISTTGLNGQAWGVVGGVQQWYTPTGSGTVNTGGSYAMAQYPSTANAAVSPAQVFLDALSGQNMTVGTGSGNGSIKSAIIGGSGYAKQYQTGGGNNGIANCFLAGVNVCVADPTYAATENYDSRTVGAIRSPAGFNAHFIDQRGGQQTDYYMDPAPNAMPNLQATRVGHTTVCSYTNPNNGFPNQSFSTFCNLEIGWYTGPGIQRGNAAVGTSAWWTVPVMHAYQFTVNTPGISEVQSWVATKSGTGDNTGFYDYSTSYGGATGTSDEGSEGFSANTGEQGSTYTGTVSSVTDAQHFKTTCTSDCGFQGDGRYITNTVPVLTSYVTAHFAPSGNLPGTFIINDPIASASTFWGTLSSNVVTPVSSTITTGTSMTFNVASATIGGVANTGAPAIGDLVCFNGQFHEQARLTNVTGSGPWTVTVPLRLPHQSGSVMMANGPCGTFINFTANQATAGSYTLKYPMDIIGATNTTSLQYAFFSYGTGTQNWALRSGNVVLVSATNVSSLTNYAGIVTMSGPNANNGYLFSAPAITISGASDSAFNGTCTNTTWNGVTLSCTQASSVGHVAGGVTATVTVGTTGYGNTNFTLLNGAEVIDVQDYATTPPTVDGAFMVEPNNMSLVATNTVEQHHHYSLSFQHEHGAQTVYGPMAQGTNQGRSLVFYGAGIVGGNVLNSAGGVDDVFVNTNPFSMYAGGGSQAPFGGLMFAGPHAYLASMINAPTGGNLIYVGCPGSTAGCNDYNASYALNFQGASGFQGGLTWKPAVNELTLSGLAVFNQPLGSTTFNDNIVFASPAAPTPTFTQSSINGTLGAGTYCYRIAVRNIASGGPGIPGTEACTTFAGGTTNSVLVSWGRVAGAFNAGFGYYVYGRTTGAELFMANGVALDVPTFLDNGSITPSGAMPATDATRAGFTGAQFGSFLSSGTAFTTTIKAATGIAGNTTITLPATTSTLVGSASPAFTGNMTLAGNLALGTHSSAGTTTPIFIDEGATYGTNTAGTSGNCKLMLYFDGTNANCIGISNGVTEYQATSGNSHVFYVAGVAKATISPTAFNIPTASTYQINGTQISSANLSDSTSIAKNVATCGTTTTCSNTAQTSPRIVHGNVALTAGSAVVASMTAWTATTSFDCTGTDKTAATAVQIVNTSTTSITITGTGTDVIAYVCVGN